MRRLLAAALLPVAACERRPPPPDPEILELATAAAEGDSVARHNLAVEFYRGDRVPRDFARAARLWRVGAARGNPSALNNFAYLTFHGLGVRADTPAALALWRRAARAGVAESNVHLGHAALGGADRVEAYARFRAAQLGGAASADSLDRVAAADAAREIEALRPPVDAAESARGEARARAYVAGAGRRPAR